MKVYSSPKEIFTKGDEALNKVNKKEYFHDLNEEGHENILKYGISFYRKDCFIKMSE